MALSRAEKIRLLQSDDQGEAEVVSTEPARGISREEKIALLQGGGEKTSATPDRLREDVTFAGSEGVGKTASGLFPRTADSVAEGKGYGKQVLSAGNDLLSLPGRALASLGKNKDESRLNSMADQEGSTFVGRTLRDPGTGAAILTAPVGGAVLGLGRAAGLGGRLLAGAGAGAIEGVASAAAHQADNVQQGKDVSLGQAGLEVGLNAAMPVAMGLAGAGIKQGLRGAGGLLKVHGEKVATTNIKPSLKDMKDGFRIQNLYKHGLEGSLEETEEKLGLKFADLNQQLSQKIQGSPEKIDMLDMLDDATKTITGNKADSFGKNSQMEKAAAFLLDEINEVAPDGVIDMATAQKLKRGLGKLGAWEWGKTDPESSAREALANAVYSRLKKEIEDKAPEGVREINQQLAELIPIERAVTRRIPIEARNSGLSLTDVIAGTSTAAGGMAAGGPAGLLAGVGGIALNKARKSPALAGKAYRLGEGVQRINLPELRTINAANRRGLATGLFRPEEETEK